MKMRFCLRLVFLALIVSPACAETFVERVALAKKIETQDAASEYFQQNLFPVIGPFMGGIMKYCIALPGSTTDRFTLVANITRGGGFVDIDYEPKSHATAACFAGEFEKLAGPPPTLCEDGVLPLVIEMEVTP